MKNRPHPALRAYEGEERGKGIKVWVDRSKNGEKMGIAWMRRGESGEMREGRMRVTGELTNNEIEAKAIMEGIKAGREGAGVGKPVIVISDSKVVVNQLKIYNTRWWAVNEIQKEIETGMEEGNSVLVKWERTGSVENKKVDRLARELVANVEEEEGMEMEGRNKRWLLEWR